MLSTTQSCSQSITSNFEVFEQEIQLVSSEFKDMCLKIDRISINIILRAFDGFICGSQSFVRRINENLSKIVEANPELKEKTTIISDFNLFARKIESARTDCERMRSKSDQIRNGVVIERFGKFMRETTSFVKKSDEDLTKILGEIPN